MACAGISTPRAGLRRSSSFSSDEPARHILIRALGEAARTKGDLIDLINVGIEELVRERCELPAFSTLEKAARKVRATRNRQLYRNTHGQSTTIFGLAFLLGIHLYPRIRGWKKLVWCRPSAESRYAHIDTLFAESADWEVIATHLPDMLRVALSITEGLLTPSTILRRLGTYSRKNRLYHAFFELGRVVRTGFLLRYIADRELQATTQAAMNKNESFNCFAQWVTFGDDGTITENDRLEQHLD
jgi:TnpA family transposase